mmetsp:Transcript_35560/g.72739  ORF Transcript_35560/g.72739 Transcript_35560/m.72739 type:complete len:92 (+) Transcript_35560:32-307(+)
MITIFIYSRVFIQLALSPAFLFFRATKASTRTTTNKSNNIPTLKPVEYCTPRKSRTSCTLAVPEAEFPHAAKTPLPSHGTGLSNTSCTDEL